ncbi:MAG: bifunctional 5,10-methylenetetrahydrofolate dehydrogenase/5,10-methenyltetrahydrofolate cyclohydrolase [bacterium]|nr:bifunctional 5,10-methylenetetrahydrofolate dehydrogenase/5,10-methenyltetrahydrofolate cyclohydrolase [bacterium]
MDGIKLKEKILNEVKCEVQKLDFTPSLCVIQVGNNPASNVYIKQKEIMCNNVGYKFIHKKLSDDITEKEILHLIDKLNKSDDITSILIQMPLPDYLDEKKIQNRVNPLKDVDGLNDINIINLINNKQGLKPCTALGVLELLNEYKITLKGKKIAIIGRSTLVGMPLFHLLENKDATVTLCHSKTINLKEITLNSDIVICAVGKKHLITQDMINKDTIVIDVGINKENGILYGDVDFENIKNKASYITPVPGGVGPLTIACLAKNILESYNIQK